MSIIDCSTLNIMNTKENLKTLIRIYSTWIYIILILISLSSLVVIVIEGKEICYNCPCNTKDFISMIVIVGIIFIVNLTGLLFNILYKRMNKRLYYYFTLIFSLLGMVVLILFFKQLLSYD